MSKYRSKRIFYFEKLGAHNTSKLVSAGKERDKGADTAIVAKSTFSASIFSSDSAQRFQVSEIIAMPRKKRWYRRIGVRDL